LGNILQKKTRGILEDLDLFLSTRDQNQVLESRAVNIIQGAINIINSIRVSYDEETALELERRLINSIRMQDPAKFTRKLRSLNSKLDEDGDEN
jgi:hypothetical protein